MLLEGEGMARDPRAALGWFQKAAGQGDLDALNMAGRCFENGWGVTRDHAAAADLYRRAADGGHAWAQYNLGHLYLNGLGVEQDLVQAFAYYLRAALASHARAMNLVGRCHEQGWGTAQDPLQARIWYRRSAEQGYFRGQYNWATILLDEGEVDRAVFWFERAAQAGSDAVRRTILAAARESQHAPLRALAGRIQALIGQTHRCAGADRLVPA
jgi:TPR repeat protein